MAQEGSMDGWWWDEISSRGQALPSWTPALGAGGDTHDKRRENGRDQFGAEGDAVSQRYRMERTDWWAEG